MNSKEAYEYVIADLEQDVGWEPEAMETTLSVLKQRLHLITDVHPTLFADSPDPIDDDNIAKWVNESFDASLKNKTNIVDEMMSRMSKFKQDDANE